MRSEVRGVDRTFIGLVAGLVIFGAIMLMSASGPNSYDIYGDSLYMFKHQLFFGIVPGILLFSLVSFLDYRKLRPWAFPALIASIVLLLLVYVPGVGLHFGGSSRWVKIGPLSFQPSEFVKVTFLLYAAGWLAARHEHDAKTLDKGLAPFILALGAIALLLIKQPNTGSMTVIVLSSFAAYFVAGAPLAWITGLGAAGLGLIVLLIKLTPYRAARFMTFMHPELDPRGIGYHINQAYLAIGSGGLFGFGYGHSRQKYLYLPEVAGDSIFAVIAEEMGFFISVALIAVLALLVVRCFDIARRSSDSFGAFLATGIGAWIGAQTLLNIASMIGLMPITGVTLPFVSYGSSAFLALSLGCGLVASVSRYGRAV